MKLTLKEKAKLFWDRNKGMILGLVAMAGAATAIGAVGAHYSAKAEKKHQEELEEARKAYLEEAQKEKEKIKNDPANQIAGGYVRPENDGLCDAEYPNILVNSVPIVNMGELGQEVIQRLNEEWFGEFGETGVENHFDPATATVDVIIDFGHEVWKRNNPEDAESQEKQSA